MKLAADSGLEFIRQEGSFISRFENVFAVWKERSAWLKKRLKGHGCTENWTQQRPPPEGLFAEWGREIYPWSETSLACLVLCLVVFVAHFIFLPDFGLYEDDLIYVLPTLPWRFSDWIHYLVTSVPTFPQGRPIYYALQPTLTFFLFKVGGLQLCHLFSCLIVAINGILAFYLLRRLLIPEAAMVGALICVLFPIDTSRQLLMHQGALLLPMALLLGSLHLYVRDRRITATILASLLLLTYESFYLPFIVAPLLGKQRGVELVKRCTLHVVVFFVVAGGVLLIRNFFGEERAREVLKNGGNIAPKIIQACLEGPGMGAKLLLMRPIDAWRHSSPFETLLALFVFSITLFSLWRLHQHDRQPIANMVTRLPHRLGVPWVAGVIAWSISYLLSFRPDYFPPIASIGRLSGVHSGAALGAAITVGCCFQALSEMPWRNLDIVLLWAASFMIGGMAAFGIQIQRSEYVNYWEQEKRFLMGLLNEIRDVREGDVIILEYSADPHVIPTTKSFGSYDQVVYGPLVLPYFIKFPETWKLKPRIYTYDRSATREQETPEGMRLETPDWNSALWPTLTADNLIYLRVAASKLIRVTGAVEIGGRQFEARPSPTILPGPLAWSELFQKMVKPDDSKHWMTIEKAVNYPR